MTQTAFYIDFWKSIGDKRLGAYFCRKRRSIVMLWADKTQGAMHRFTLLNLLNGTLKGRFSIKDMQFETLKFSQKTVYQSVAALTLYLFTNSSEEGQMEDEKVKPEYR